MAQSIADFVRSIILIGEDADKIEEALADVVPIARASSLDNAIVVAKAQAKPGDVVLLSPCLCQFGYVSMILIIAVNYLLP